MPPIHTPAASRALARCVNYTQQLAETFDALAAEHPTLYTELSREFRWIEMLTPLGLRARFARYELTAGRK